MDINERVNKALELKKSGYNCAQAVTAAFADLTELTEEQLKQISAGFGAGMGNMEATCGALVGAGIIAGLKTQGTGSTKLTKLMVEQFNAKCGATQCKLLKTKTDGKPLCSCEDCVKNAVMICAEILGIQ